MLDTNVAEYLQSHRRQHLEKLLELLRFASIANVEAGDPGQDQCQLCAEWLAEHLAGLGLSVEIVRTAGKPNVLASAHVSDDAPTLLFYGHYDVQPPDPLELWDSDPFEPVVRNGCIWARGASDNKGQLFTHLMAIEAWRQTGGGLPVNVKVLIEGEEEIGSPNLEPFVAANIDRLRADAAIVSDSDFFSDGAASITYSLRGLAYVELTLRGPKTDIHSGLHGGAVTNPINALAGMLAKMHDDAGRVTLPGFYDDVAALTDAERDEWTRLPFDEDEYAGSLGVGALGGGERGYSALQRRWARPTLDCNGIVGGYTAAGAKTIIPSQATAKISMRLVPSQEPKKIVAGFREFVAANTPDGVTAEVSVHASARPVMLARNCSAIQAGRAAMKEAFESEVTMIRCGASVPVVELIQRILGLETAMLGFGLPSDNLHSPNEHFRLDQFYRGSIAAAAFMGNLAASRSR